MKKTKRVLFYLICAMSAYLAIGYLFHLFIFPEKQPEITSYFRSGDEFYSQSEGFRQKITRQDDDFVYCTLEIEPFAEGPPKHIHTSFDEYFEPDNGIITVWLDGKTVKVNPGEVLNVPKGVPHTFYNESPDTIQLKKEYAFPKDFAFYLNQVYGYMDANPSFGEMPATLFQMSMFQARGFDSYIAEGPPVFVQKATGFLVIPLARLLGYKSYYEEYFPPAQVDQIFEE